MTTETRPTYTEEEDAYLESIRGTHEEHRLIGEQDEDCDDCAEDVAQMWERLMRPY